MKINNDYQIMSFTDGFNIHTRNGDGTYSITPGTSRSLETLLAREDCKVLSIKYIPKDVIFTLNDTVLYKGIVDRVYNIEKFCVFNVGKEKLISARGRDIQGELDINLCAIKKLKSNKMIKEFELSEKWFIKVTPLNKQVLKNWNKQRVEDSYWGETLRGYLLSDLNDDGSGQNWGEECYLINDGYKEITFEQFEKYVLNKKEMKKYKINDIIENKIVVICNNNQEVDQLTKAIAITNKAGNSDVWKNGFNPELSVKFPVEVIFLDGMISWQSDFQGKYFLTKNYTDKCINFNQIKFEDKKPTGFKLIKEYPGSKGLGYIEKYSTGEFGNYPEFWEPVYELEKVEFIAGDKKMKVVITKDKIIVGIEEISPRFLVDVLDDMTNNQFKEQPTHPITFLNVKIGCTIFTLDEIRKAVSEFNRLNRI